MKFERKGGEYNLLESEAYFLFNLKGFGIPKIITFGKCGIYNILIEELLGPSINSIFELKKHKFLIKDICMLGIQILDRLEFIHSKDVIHRDIKPLNFIIGRKDPKNIYIIDFSFAHKYRSSRTGKHIQFKNTHTLIGSLRYISINANKGFEQSRRDDLESVGYMLVYLAKYYLPWLSIDKKLNLDFQIKCKEVSKIKNSNTPENICKGLPEEFIEYLKYTRNLEFEQDPDYNYLRNLFITVLIKNQQNNDLLFSWNIKKRLTNKEKTNENKLDEKNCSIYKRRESSRKRLYNKIKNNLEKSKSQKVMNTLKLKKEDIKESKSSVKLKKNNDSLELKNKNNININNISSDNKFENSIGLIKKIILLTIKQ